MTEAQYATALAASAAATRRAYKAHNNRMAAGIDVGRTKAPVIVAICEDLKAHPGSTTDQISDRTGYAIRSVQDGLNTMLKAGKVRAEAHQYSRIFTMRAST